jgi:enamine deaminase RidA (YjgF/YER057c/UK114 family)
MSLQFFSSPTPLASDTAHVLGAGLLGLQAPAAAPAWPLQHVRAPLLGSDGLSFHEAWRVDSAPLAGVTEGIRWRRAGDLLFGVIELAEEPGRSDLRTLSEQAYARLFRLLDAQALPHLWRVWNYMADINGSADGLERYRQFNLGRAEAFLQGARSVVGRVPAACALGLAGGPLSIAFLAGPTPAVPIENPRQVSAYHYPADYGPRSPTFSRAALVYPPGQELLFISGTASIVGHQSVHPGDVVAQTRESMDNVAVVLDQANQRSRSGGHALGALSYRVYIRHAADAPRVQAVMAERVGAAPVVCVLADVCRAELLVEVEAQGLRSL